MRGKKSFACVIRTALAMADATPTPCASSAHIPARKLTTAAVRQLLAALCVNFQTSASVTTAKMPGKIPPSKMSAGVTILVGIVRRLFRNTLEADRHGHFIADAGDHVRHAEFAPQELGFAEEAGMLFIIHRAHADLQKPQR